MQQSSTGVSISQLPWHLLEEEMATHSDILAWRIPWTEEPGRLQSIDGKESDMTEHTRSVLMRTE